MNYSPVEVAMAISLYSYNVPAMTRAQKLYDHFDGNCAELIDLVDILHQRGEFFATELAYPTAKVYIDHALVMYGAEARYRCAVNESLEET